VDFLFNIGYIDGRAFVHVLELLQRTVP